MKKECETVRRHDATATFFVFVHFHAVTVRVTAICRIDCFACQDKFFVNNQSLWCKKNDEHALDFALHLSHLFGLKWVWTFGASLMLSSPNARLIIARISVTFFPRFAQYLTHTCCWVHRETAPGQIYDSKHKDVNISTSQFHRSQLLQLSVHSS
jgi:hypothetical protein